MTKSPSSLKRLYRSCDNRLLAGVGGGIAEYFELDPTVVRLVLLLIILTAGAGILFYLAAWLIIPEDPNCSQPLGQRDN